MSIVSVIIPTYNAGSALYDCVKAVLDNEHILEVIIVDDGSIDGSTDKELLSASSKIKLIRHEENMGVAVARNTGLSAVQGEYVAFCDADDVWTKNKIIEQLGHPRASDSVLCTGIEIHRAKRVSFIKPPSNIGLTDLFVRNYVGLSSTMMPTKIAKKYSFERVRHEDYLMWLKMAMDGVPFFGLSKVCVTKYENGKNITNSKLRSLLWHFKVQRMLKLPVYRIFYYFLLNFISRIRDKI